MFLFKSWKKKTKPFLRIWAEKIPSVGYKLYEIQPGSEKTTKSPFIGKGNSIENQFYTIEAAPNGAITSLVDKHNHHSEFAKEIEGRRINDIGSATGTLQIINVGPVSISLQAQSDAPLRHTTTITLFRKSDRIEILNEINQNFDDLYTYSFGLNLINPEVHHEETGAIALAKTVDHGGNYASRTARYDWLTFNHFADMSDKKAGITISNQDSLFFQLGNSTIQKLDEYTPKISALIGGQIDGKKPGDATSGRQHSFHKTAMLCALIRNTIQLKP